jgi:hypothetical protein
VMLCMAFSQHGTNPPVSVGPFCRRPETSRRNLTRLRQCLATDLRNTSRFPRKITTTKHGVRYTPRAAKLLASSS